MGDEDLCYMGAVEALRRFKARTLSPVELVRALIARAEAVEPRINAFGHRFFDRALAQARRAEERYGRSGARLRPLEGIPVVIKDETAIKGERTAFASLIHRENVDDHTAPPAERLLGAGAILLARSTAPEFSCAAVTHSRLWGVTRNPWNSDYTPGGSSGGAAAALAAGTTTIANGSDIGGSIRIPASACGVVGFKPPYGRVPDEPFFNLDWYCHAGPMARSVADCALVENVMAGPHPRDIVAIRPKLRIPPVLGEMKGRRVALSVDLGYFPVDPEVERNTRAAAAVFRSLGAVVEEVELGWTEAAYTAFDHHINAIFGTFLGKYLEKHADALTAYARSFAERARATRPADLLAAMETEGKMYERLGALFRRYEILLCPTLALPAVPAEHDPYGPELEIAGRRVSAWIGWCMTYPFNMMSRCPVMSVPSGRAANGVPTGLQIVGRPYDDVAVFRAAAAFERAQPWLDSPERRPRL